MKNKSVTNIQGALGLILLATAGIWVWCHLTGLNTEEGPVRAQAEATELAHAVLDFRTDTGQWPLDSTGQPDLTQLLDRQATRPNTSLALAPTGGMGGLGAMGATGKSSDREMSWLREIPLDPWGGIFQVYFSGSRVAIVSPGPNGQPDTDPNRLWTRPGNINPGQGDDIGVVLDFDMDGGSR